ncbi:MAG: 30S ribosome-binding factor RbfA [Actinomycetaceae bacterium]|nr:30S ribosome-binding factor RbfA [Actinomycetaceae bacterium]MDU0971198.1 30S ribosome-binding factor RbfA [Actinomycetaceae bacterium]
MADEARQRKVADRIQQTVARLLERRIKDPRIGFCTITDVRVTGDLQHATIFYTVYGTEGERRRTHQALNSAKGLIRSEVGKALGIRLTPSIEFVHDALPQQAASFEEALAKARQRDAEMAEAAKSATYAGEEDPYKAPREQADDEDVDLDEDDSFDDLDDLDQTGEDS